MPRIHIVTDSCATFSNPRLIKHFPMTILPNYIEINGERYQENIDLDPEAAFARFAKPGCQPRVIPPAESDFAELYRRLAPHFDVIISIHPSRELSASWRNGKLAAQHIGKDCEIAVVDSGSVCAGQGMLARVAARAAFDKLEIDEAIHAVRQAANRAYSMYCVSSLDYLGRSAILSPSHTILAKRLGIRPFVSVEDGKLIVVEKARTRAQSIERLVEFLVEFDALDDVVILQHQREISQETRILQDRLTLEFPGQHFPFTMYSASMGALLGPAAIGIAVLETEAEESEYDF